jgi:hypothetical protein
MVLATEVKTLRNDLRFPALVQGRGSYFAVFQPIQSTDGEFTPKSLRSHFREHALETPKALSFCVGRSRRVRGPEGFCRE